MRGWLDDDARAQKCVCLLVTEQLSEGLLTCASLQKRSRLCNPSTGYCHLVNEVSVQASTRGEDENAVTNDPQRGFLWKFPWYHLSPAAFGGMIKQTDFLFLQEKQE